MENSSAPASPRLGSPRVAECWADLARALAIYPATNIRVVRTLGAFFEALRPKFDATTNVVDVCFSAGAVWVDEDAFDLKPGTNLAWLKDRLDRADLSGAAFASTATEESVLAFAQRMLDLFSRQDLDLSFQELWPTPHTGITLLERRFEGPFLEPGSDAAGASLPGVVSRARLKVRNLRNALAADPRVRSASERVQARLAGASTDKERGSGFDMIGEIVDVLPAEGLHDFATALKMSERILVTLEQELAKGQVPEAPTDKEENAGLRRLVFLISRSHFNSIDTGPRVLRMASDKTEPATIARPGADPHAKDAHIADDLGALLAEMAGLSPVRSDFPGTEDVSDPAEELGVYLHYLITEDDPSKFPTLKEGIGRLLASSGDTGMAIVRRYLEASRSSDPRLRALRLGRVATWLRANGHKEYLEKCGLLSSEWISRQFPDEFLAFLESLDLDDAREVKKLDAACRAIGARRFLEAQDPLADATGFVDGPIARQLFNLPITSIGPLLRRIYEKNPPRHEAALANYARTKAITRLDRAILEVVEETPSGLPPYWTALFDDDPEKLAEQRAQVVHSFLGATEGDPSKHDQHVRAIKLLANFNTQRTRQYLERIVRDRGAFGLKKHPRSFRAAASEALEMLWESEGGKDV